MEKNKKETYSVNPIGHKARINMDVSFNENKISDISITNHKETKRIGGLAIDRVPKEIIEHQSLKVDGVSGATKTTKAIINGVREAIEMADENILDEYNN